MQICSLDWFMLLKDLFPLLLCSLSGFLFHGGGFSMFYGSVFLCARFRYPLLFRRRRYIHATL